MYILNMKADLIHELEKEIQEILLCEELSEKDKIFILREIYAQLHLIGD